jgi:tetratricopeptide (TPR) repeat protein
MTPDVVRSAREDLDPGLIALLDSGNAAIRADDPSKAEDYYRRALEIDTSSAAAWFGIYMASQALGREGEAREALERARDLAPAASLLDPDTTPR